MRPHNSVRRCRSLRERRVRAADAMTTFRRLYGAALALCTLVVVLGVLLPRGRPRSWQTAGFTGMAAASVLYAAAAVPVVLVRGAKRLVPRRGAFDVEPDQERSVEPFEAV